MELCAFKRNNFILNKLIPCLMVILFISMCLYGSNVYATSTISSIDVFGYNVSYDETLFEDFNYIIYLYPQGNYLGCDVYVSDYDISHLTLNSPGQSWASYSITIPSGYKQISFGGTLGTLSNINSDSASNVLQSIIIENVSQIKNTSVQTNNTTLSISCRSSYSSGVFSSNNSIYVGNNEVFQVPPQVQETQAIIAEQVGEVEMNRTLSEIMGILPIVIVVILGLIAIRKGIIFLIALMKRQ